MTCALLGQANGALVENIEAYGPGGFGGGMETLYAGAAYGHTGIQMVTVRIGANTLAAVSPRLSLVREVFDRPTDVRVDPASRVTQSTVGIRVGLQQ